MDVRKTCNSIQDQRKGRYFEAMLALNQKQFELALDLADDGDYFLANNIKLLAMIGLNNWAGVCDLLYKIKKNRLLDGTRYRVSTEVVGAHTKISNKFFSQSNRYTTTAMVVLAKFTIFCVIFLFFLFCKYSTKILSVKNTIPFLPVCIYLNLN